MFSFKRLLDLDKPPKPPDYFLTGSRKAQILHTRLRTDCSSLNGHLFSKGLINSPNCACGQLESVCHYLLYCNIYAAQRQRMFQELYQLHNQFPVNKNLLLFGDTELSFEIIQDSYKSLFICVSF